MILLKSINEKNYAKAMDNNYLQDSMVIKEEFKGCLFIYDDGFEKYYNSFQVLDELDEWLYRRGYYNKEGNK